MKSSAPLLLFFILFTIFNVVKADVPPDPGFVRRASSVTIETKEDVSAYRFFIESPNGLEEIAVATDKPTVIDGSKRGGPARFGNVWAIPRTTIGDDFGTSAQEKLNGMRKTLIEGGIQGAVKLFSHSFQATVKKEEADKWKDPVYRIEKDGEKSIKAVLVSGGAVETKVAASAYSTDPKSSGFWATVIGGSLMTLAFICFGVWAIRRSNKPRNLGATSK